MKKINKLLTVVLFAALSVISCKNNFSDLENEIENEKAYLSFGINESEERMVAPEPITWDDVSSIELKKDNSLLKTWTSYAQMKADTSVVLDAGTYTFEVTLKDADCDILQTGKLENVEIKAGNNPLNFKTKTFLEGKGTLSISCYVEFAYNISSAKVYLNGELYDSFEYSQGIDENLITFSPEEVDCGNYILTIELYYNSEYVVKTTDFIEIQNKRETVYNYNYYENIDVYPVEFFIEDGIQDDSAVIFTDDVDIKAYTTDKTLPSPDKIVNKPEGLEFFGWYNENISITELPKHARGVVKVYARFGKSIEKKEDYDENISFYKITPSNQDEWEFIYNSLKGDSGKEVSLNLSKLDLTDISSYFGEYFVPTLREIVIPANVETIPNNAFIGYNYLESVKFAKGSKLKTIFNNAFNGCYSLREITIPKGVEEIGCEAFSCCNSLKKVTFESESELTVIEDSVFNQCYSLEEIVIPAKVQTIDSSAFKECKNLKKVTFETGSELTEIKDEAFYNCLALEDIVIPSTVTEISSEAFMCCGKLTSKVFSANPNLVHIGNEAFFGCTSLTSINIPSSVEIIGGLAFSGCTNLATVTFENNSSLEVIDNQAFENCTSLTEIVIPQSVTYFGESVFNGCTNLTKFTVPQIAVEKLSEFITSEDCNFKVIIPDGIDYIESNIFEEAIALTEVVISASVTIIRNSAFLGCTNLKTVTFTDDSKLESIEMYAFYKCSALTDFVIPASVCGIGWNSFLGCTSLTSINIPLSVETIGETAFYGCTNLATVTFENNSSLTTIDDQAFANCSALKEIVLPEGVTKISYGLFDCCTLLESVVIPEGVTLIDENAFDDCTSLTSINIPSSVEIIGKKAFYICEKLAAVTFAEGSVLQTIGDSAFEGCITLKEIVIPKNVVEIGVNAFRGCRQLKTVTFAEGSVLQTIGDSAFYGCEALTEIVIPESVVTIRVNTFRDCRQLKTVTFAEDSSLESIEEFAFNGCEALTEINIPDRVNFIAENAFYGCPYQPFD